MATADIAYDDLEPTSVVAYVRSLIPDMEQLPNPLNPADEPSYLFDDATIDRFIAFARSNHPKLAAADACHAVAGSEMLILKSITTEDLVTKGDALGKQWEDKANNLRREGLADLEEDKFDNGGVFTAPFVRRPQPYQPNQYPIAGRGWW